MRVLLLSVDSEKSKGGVAEWTKQYKKACLQTEIEFDIVDMSAVGKMVEHTTGKRNLINEYRRFRRIRTELGIKLRHKKFDVAHINTNIGYFGIVRDYCLARMIKHHGIPIILHFHCDIPFWIKNALVHLFTYRILLISSGVFVLNESSQSYLKTEFRTNSIIIPNFVNDSQIVKEKPISEEIQICLFVGRVSYLKGIRELYEVARAFPNIKFVLVGEISKDSKALKTPQNIDMVGVKSHEDVMCLVDNADVFLLPSHTEGFSIALLEAMARGVPIIASNVGSNADMLENKGGIIVPLGQNEAWIEAMNRIDNRVVRKRMSDWNIQKTRKAYSSSHVIGMIKAAYRRSIDQ